MVKRNLNARKRERGDLFFKYYNRSLDAERDRDWERETDVMKC